MQKKVYISGKQSFLNGIIAIIIAIFFAILALIGIHSDFMFAVLIGYAVAYLSGICGFMFEINAFVNHKLNK